MLFLRSPALSSLLGGRGRKRDKRHGGRVHSCAGGVREKECMLPAMHACRVYKQPWYCTKKPVYHAKNRRTYRSVHRVTFELACERWVSWNPWDTRSRDEVLRTRQITVMTSLALRSALAVHARTPARCVYPRVGPVCYQGINTFSCAYRVTSTTGSAFNQPIETCTQQGCA